MSDEEQAVLNFFAQEENLPLALSVAEQTDGIRQRMNTDFWLALRERIAALLLAHDLPWQAETTEDRNAPDCVVGVHLQPIKDQPLYLRPMLEQQAMGDTLRIYHGLAWSSTPTTDQTRLAEVAALRESLQEDGFKNNENFLAWGWTPHRPRRRDFLLRFSSDKDALLNEVTELMRHLVVDHRTAFDAANAVLGAAPRSAAVSLDQLRSKITG